MSGELSGRRFEAGVTAMSLTTRVRSLLKDHAAAVAAPEGSPERVEWLRRWSDYMGDTQRLWSRLQELIAVDDELTADIARLGWPPV